MTIASYSELVSELSGSDGWLNRADLTARIPSFIRLFEARMNRRLRDPDMEQTATIELVAGTDTYALPTGFRGARQVYIDAVPRINLVPMSPQSLHAEFTGQEDANSQAYTIIGSDIVLAPTPTDEGTLTIVFYKHLTGLDSGNATNWLLDDHPDAYLFGSMARAHFYLRDMEQASNCEGLVDAIVDEIRLDGIKRRLPGGPLATRPAVIE